MEDQEVGQFHKIKMSWAKDLSLHLSKPMMMTRVVSCNAHSMSKTLFRQSLIEMGSTST